MSESQADNKLERTSMSIRWYFIALLAGTVLLFVVNLALGSVDIPIGEIVSILLGDGSTHEAWTKIVTNIRLPRAFTAILAGSALSIGGLQMQTLFRNPLAGPSVLGITAGASLGVAVVMLTTGTITSIFAIQQLSSFGSWIIVIAASIGSFLVLLLILAISVRIRDNVTLLIIGLMIANITIALVSIWQYFSKPEQIQDYLIWTFGSLGGVTMNQISILVIIILIGSGIAFLLSKPLNGLLLGENYARSMGFSVQKARIWVIISTSLLAGSITAFCGPIGFVGVAVPHLTRSLLGTNDHRILIPSTFLMGALLMLGCDIIAQVPGSTTTLPISAVTSLVGSPVVVWVIVQRKNLQASFS
ncbi:iron ABC transporter permease [Aliifodinibius sp. S!AR15-10]|uniref:FecCD family ABC transporter permease n=1 Tax=Aliifodinibius sp. S!AR15-10 TaxID=2950437 RepID=UPI0028571099|nr:iron ABC transporter permease [Aliifodinibius sp. S!AR15-10]MDR8391808.1 iron ABC transporter permease [Aliifodinibius sp. S!AR15-10]